MMMMEEFDGAGSVEMMDFIGVGKSIREVLTTLHKELELIVLNKDHYLNKDRSIDKDTRLSVLGKRIRVSPHLTRLKKNQRSEPNIENCIIATHHHSTTTTTPPEKNP